MHCRLADQRKGIRSRIYTQAKNNKQPVHPAIHPYMQCIFVIYRDEEEETLLLQQEKAKPADSPRPVRQTFVLPPTHPLTQPILHEIQEDTVQIQTETSYCATYVKKKNKVPSNAANVMEVETRNLKPIEKPPSAIVVNNKEKVKLQKGSSKNETRLMPPSLPFLTQP